MDFRPGKLQHGSGDAVVDAVPDERQTLPYSHNAGMDFQYPAPLFVHNTFLEVRPDRSTSLTEGFYEPREVTSCPSSSIAPFEGNAGEPARVMPRGPKLYCPGEVLTRTALLDSELALGSASVSSVPPGLADLKQSADCMSPWLRTNQEPTSQCSTVDSATSAQEAYETPPRIFSLSMSNDEMSSASLTPAVEYEGLPPDSDLGLPTLPTVGSKAHYFNQCKPCAFNYTDGCENGVGCVFCHLCQPGEKKRRKKEKQTVVKAMRQLRAVQMNQWNTYMGR